MMVEFSQDAMYRPGIGVMMFNHQKKIFVARHVNPLIDGWQMPQGGIEKSETPHQAALRELKEETSICDVKIIAESQSWYCYDFHISLPLKPELKRFRGQRQKWFAMHFQGIDQQINLCTESPEFFDWKWTSIDSLTNIVTASKRDLYHYVCQELKPLIYAYL